jgi:oligopeptide transport system ATP-binding protein
MARSGVVQKITIAAKAPEEAITIPGNPPNLLRLPKGCPFQPRCPHAMEICNSAPPLVEFAPGRLRACFKPYEELV